MSRNYVYSTLTADVQYTNFRAGPNNVPSAIPVAGKTGVFIKGGRGVASRGRSLITPLGVSTEVTDEQLTYLEGCVSFRKHRANGFIVVMQRDVDPEKVAADMTEKDGSAPLTPADIPEGVKTVSTETAKDEKPAGSRRGGRKGFDA